MAYYILWQWLQSFARVIQVLVDGEALGGGLFGPTVERAFWYSEASLLIIAVSLAIQLPLALGMAILRRKPEKRAEEERTISHSD